MFLAQKIAMSSPSPVFSLLESGWVAYDSRKWLFHPVSQSFNPRRPGGLFMVKKITISSPIPVF